MKFSLYIIIIHTGRLYHVDYSKLGAVLIHVANTLATANDRERELGIAVCDQPCFFSLISQAN